MKVGDKVKVTGVESWYKNNIGIITHKVGSSLRVKFSHIPGSLLYYPSSLTLIKKKLTFPKLCRPWK